MIASIDVQIESVAQPASVDRSKPGKPDPIVVREINRYNTSYPPFGLVQCSRLPAKLRSETGHMTRDELISALRSALMHLDNYANLRHNALLPLLCAGATEPNPVTLQRRLVDAIHALRFAPEPSTQRYYQVLLYRYVEHLSQSEVAFQLGISERQLRREQSNAIELLADRLAEPLAASPSPSAPLAPPTNSPTTDAVAANAVAAEVGRLQAEFPGSAGHINLELERAAEGVAALAAHYAVDLAITAPPDELLAPIPPPALRQVFLTVLAELIPRAAHGRLAVTWQHAEAELIMVLTPQPAASSLLVPEENRARLAVVAQLLAPFGGAAHPQAPTSPAVAITLPVILGAPILVVEDNPDTGLLYQRFVANSRYRLFVTADGREALALAAQHAVAALVVDIMMPDLDGWDLLAQFRHHPATRNLPIAVCSVLPQQELAGILGANLFLQKPATRHRFLALLDALTAHG